MRFRHGARVWLVTAVAATGLAACGGSGQDHSTSANGLEKSRLTVGVVPVPDSAPLFIAQQRGFFKQEGLTIKTEVIKASPEATPKLLNGSMDLALLNYVSTFAAQDNGAIKFKLLSDGYQGAAKSFAIMVRKDSQVKTPADLRGKKVAIPAPKSITDLLLAINLKSHGLAGGKDVKTVPVPLPNMAAALKRGTVDAIATVEPFVTNVQTEQGARLLADLVSGPAEEFPIAGWGGTAKFAEKNPRTVAAFQRAIGRALKIAAESRDEVSRVLPAYTSIPAKTAQVIALGEYPTTLNQARLQRVADFMMSYGYLKAKPDLAQMLVAPPK